MEQSNELNQRKDVLPPSKCPHCRGMVEGVPAPTVELVNGMGCSMLIFYHVEDLRCGNCLKSLVPRMVGADLRGATFVLTPDPRDRSGLIIPKNGPEIFSP